MTALLLCSCNPESDPTNSTPLRVGMVRWSGVDLLQYQRLQAMRNHLPSNETFTLFLDIGDAQRAMLRGRIDILISSAWTMIKMPADAGPYSAFLILNQSRGADGIVTQKPYRKLADLSGQTIGIEAGTTDELMWALAQKSQHLESLPVKKFSASTQTTLNRLRAGEVAAAVTFEPYLSQLKEQIGGHIVFSSRDVDAPIFDVAFARTDVLNARPQAVQAFVNAWFATMRAYQSNPQEVVTRVSRHLGMHSSELGEALKTLQLGDIALNQRILANPTAFDELVGEMKSILHTSTLQAPTMVATFVNAASTVSPP